MSEADATEARRQRGLAIAALSRIENRGGGTWSVPSQSANGKYFVNPDEPRCNCKDFEERGQPCKHVFAVRYVIERERNPEGVETVTETVTLTRQTVAQKPTYKQNWPAYNKAQQVEKARFQVLLHELCKGVVEPPRPPKRGMQPLKACDALFSAVFKVYSTVSGRRFSCDLADAHAKGHLARLPHYNTVFTYLENPAYTPVLQAMIVESARPLKSVEVDFAVDSSGFTSSRFIRWFDHKYGKPMKEHDWVKVSVMTGVKTNVVTAVEVDERYAADCPQFQPLLGTTVANGFRPREVSADSAYLSYENMEAVGKTGAVPFIAFKANSNPDPKRGDLYARMFHLYSFNRDEYLAHYHKRSNVESTFSMIKAKFGDSLRSKTDVAMVNEALCKVLCHNVCCLIQSQYELGVEATFWGKYEEPVYHQDQARETDEMLDALAWV
jgi:transposase